jgi:hypothetical protein
LHGAFVWVCSALNSQKWWFPVWAVAQELLLRPAQVAAMGDLDTPIGATLQVRTG